MITSRLLGSHRVTRQLYRNFNFFKKSGDDAAAVTPKDEIKDHNIIPPPIPEPSKLTNIIEKRNLPYLSEFTPVRQAWVENLDTVDRNILGLMDIHPDIFGVVPRLDIIWENVVWQQMYQKVNWENPPVRCEVRRSWRKPWPQKGTGRARHGTKKTVIWKGGEVQKANRAPETSFFMLKYFKRVEGLRSTLSAKLIQDDLKFVKNLDIPNTDPKYLENLAESRKWGPSVLFVDAVDLMPQNISLASDSIKHINLMPVYGLNVYSMLKHDTVVLTVDAVERIEQKLLIQLHTPRQFHGRFVLDKFVEL